VFHVCWLLGPELGVWGVKFGVGEFGVRSSEFGVRSLEFGGVKRGSVPLTPMTAGLLPRRGEQHDIDREAAVDL
jgi:hypothetical protein